MYKLKVKDSKMLIMTCESVFATFWFNLWDYS